MKVTILYHIAFSHPHPKAETHTWEGELSTAEYAYFQKFRSEYKNEYNDIREEYPEGDDAFQHDSFAQEELHALNYDILHEALPQWCNYAMLDLLDDLHILKENAAVTADNIDIDGCFFG